MDPTADTNTNSNTNTDTETETPRTCTDPEFKLEPSDPIANYEEGVPTPPNHFLNPGAMGLNSPDLTLNPGGVQ